MSAKQRPAAAGGQTAGRAPSDAARKRAARKVKVIIAGVAIAVAILSIARVTGLIGPRPTNNDPSPEIVDAHEEQIERVDENAANYMPPGQP